ncbi:hypothetical protein MCOR02_006958 [Pyricularia oryzae]|uniref:Wax synthase domain-containing protein n=1 Tax=Pyricularia oryzae TaxID=318829 RepID=A0A4P7NRG1_PYROR|nr:hypothetical protein MCOR02_006958 [Pyricularia oryzae]KAI6466425.1 hypothetical protein MCOR17_004822 [Pyricularia oryzae]KAI6505031.1 hypothetical protein MCOR13_004497 [Pyricularia oryzae]KAI6634011.1 hypothetical protein MCOR14_006396 [Pyricularia oryzae]QBZ64995.1 hypothetical protein PoMZ_06698 [Pyricularia oryzae]
MSDYVCPPSPWAASWQLIFVFVYWYTIFKVPAGRQVLRLASIVPLACISYMAQSSLVQTCQIPQWRGIGAGLLWIQLFSAIDLIAVSRAAPSHFSMSVNWGRLHAGLQSVALLWSFRRIGTLWAVTKIRPSYHGTRRSFLVRQVPALCIAYLLLDLGVSMPPPDLSLVQPPKQALWPLSGLSAPDLVFRLVGSISFWITVAILLYIIHTTVLIVGVVLHWWEPADCVPLFGYIQDAYSIRNFWGSVWHQCLRQGLSGVSTLICDTFLGIPRGTLLSRYARLNAVFAASGVLHHASDLAVGISPQETRVFSFFQVQALVIMIEDLAQFLVGKRVQRSPIMSRLAKVVGFFWVILVMAWSTPSWLYPTQRFAADPTGLLPFRVAPYLLGSR